MSTNYTTLNRNPEFKFQGEMLKELSLTEKIILIFVSACHLNCEINKLINP